MRIDEVEGIGPAYATKLGEAGVATTDDLLEQRRQAGRPGQAGRRPPGSAPSSSSSGSTTST